MGYISYQLMCANNNVIIVLKNKPQKTFFVI